MIEIRLQFRSIRIDHIEKPAPNRRGTVTVMEMDPGTAEKHSLVLKLSDVIRDRSWLYNLFTALMIIVALSGILYAALVIGVDRNFFSPQNSANRFFFILLSLTVFLVTWIGFSYKGAIRNKKNNFVSDERGKGNWKIVDEKKWDDFYRLLMISVKNKESDQETESDS